MCTKFCFEIMFSYILISLESNDLYSLTNKLVDVWLQAIKFHTYTRGRFENSCDVFALSILLLISCS